VLELGSLGSVRGALSDERPYRECENGDGLKIASGVVVGMTSVFRFLRESAPDLA
jgi:hypothetical protein